MSARDLAVYAGAISRLLFNGRIRNTVGLVAFSFCRPDHRQPSSIQGTVTDQSNAVVPGAISRSSRSPLGRSSQSRHPRPVLQLGRASCRRLPGSRAGQGLQDGATHDPGPDHRDVLGQRKAGSCQETTTVEVQTTAITRQHGNNLRCKAYSVASRSTTCPVNGRSFLDSPNWNPASRCRTEGNFESHESGYNSVFDQTRLRGGPV